MIGSRKRFTCDKPIYRFKLLHALPSDLRSGFVRVGSIYSHRKMLDVHARPTSSCTSMGR